MDALEHSDPRTVGPYEIVARIGSGAMGTVYLGEYGTQQVAIKVMIPAPLNSQTEARFRFYEEAKTLSEVDSEFVARIFEWQFKEEPYWFATEYIAGPNLGEEVTINGPLAADALHYLIDCCNEGLKALHDKKIIHQDFKPLNIVLSDGGPKIIDLGLAFNQDTSELFERGDVMGTPHYLSPEQVRGEAPTAASDYFCLGVSIYEAAVGELPWTFNSKSELESAIQDCAFEIPKQVDATVADIIRGLLVSNPNDRLTYDQINQAINQNREVPAHKARRDLQRITKPGMQSSAISDSPVTSNDVLESRHKEVDPTNNPLLNPQPKPGLVQNGVAGAVAPDIPEQQSVQAETRFLALTSKRKFDRTAIPSTPAKQFLRAQLELINQDADFLSVIPSAGKTFAARNWYEVSTFNSVQEVYTFLNWQFHIYGSSEPHDYFELADRGIDSTFLNTLWNASECLENAELSQDGLLARYWLAYLAIEFASVAEADEIIGQVVLLTYLNYLSVAVHPNARQQDARLWLNLLFNADGHNPPDMEFAVLIFMAQESLPTIEMQIESSRICAMNGLPNALGTLTWLYLTSGQVEAGFQAFNDAVSHLGSNYPDETVSKETFDYEVANAYSNAALCQLALDVKVEDALATLDECIAKGATDGAFARAVMLLRAGKSDEAKAYVEAMSPELRETISIWPEMAEISVGWFHDYAKDVLKVSKL